MKLYVGIDLHSRRKKMGQVLKREFYNPAGQYFYIFPFSRPGFFIALLRKKLMRESLPNSMKLIG